MAGVKGKSGGRRAGAGRKPKPPTADPAPSLSHDSEAADPVALKPLDFLLKVQNDPLASPALRVRAAIAAAQYVHMKRGDGGIKDGQAEAAKTAAKGRFAAVAPPLKLVKGK